MQRVWSIYAVEPQTSLRPGNSVTNFSRRSLHRRASAISDVHSTHSQATSARHLLVGMNLDNNSSVSNFAGNLAPPSLETSVNQLSGENITLASTTNLSINYIPSKFSEFRNRKLGKYDDDPTLPKTGGGLLAFKTNEARMPQGKRRLRWNKFKWVLFGTNVLLTLCSIAAFVVCLLTWFDVWDEADVIRTANAPELILSTLAALIGMLTSLIGWAGILLNNRSFLAWYTFLTWITFAFLVTPGYITYKRRTFNLEGKINAQWSRDLNTEDRQRIQNQLSCCGYFSPFVEATVSQTCYARSMLPGCKGPYLAFEKRLLRLWYTVVFSLVPVQIAVMVAGLLCSNHITYRFGKGMMPEAYRLNAHTMAVIMDTYANQLAEHYGVDTANTILHRGGPKSMSGTTPTTPTTPSVHTPHDTSRDEIPLYPFKSKYAQQSNYHAF